MADKKYNPYDNMLSVLKQSAEALGLSYEDYATLCYPERELKVSIPKRIFAVLRGCPISVCVRCLPIILFAVSFRRNLFVVIPNIRWPLCII